MATKTYNLMPSLEAVSPQLKAQFGKTGDGKVAAKAIFNGVTYVGTGANPQLALVDLRKNFDAKFRTRSSQTR